MPLSSFTSSSSPRFPSDPQAYGFVPPERPKFNSQNTADRLREGVGRPPSFSMVNTPKKDRKSVFRETGLMEDESGHTAYVGEPICEKDRRYSEAAGLSAGSKDMSESHSHGEIAGEGEVESEGNRLRIQPHQSDRKCEPTSPSSPTTGKQPWYTRLGTGRRPRLKSNESTTSPPGTNPLTSMSRFTMIALLIAVVLPGFGYHNGGSKVEGNGADAGVARLRYRGGPILDVRQNSPTSVCTRWSQQTALLNGTLYIYGGQAKTTAGQVNDTWNNNFLTLDLTKSWDNDYNNLYLYGGEFADNPYVEPAPVSTWQYAISAQGWKSYANPTTSSGNNSDPGGAPVQRAAEGAGISVPELGLSWYFGGHLDLSTTPGWSNQIARVYLKSLLEFTHPGYTNTGVQSLAGGSGAGAGGVYRNITQGGLQTDTGFSERADGVLVFVPGWGESGVLIGLGGGTADTFANDFSTLDVYDIANSVWYHQNTTGDAPGVRVNPCAVIASAPDASSFQIYVYGGQNLQPYDAQTQYSDIYILSIPAFTWVRVPDQSNAPAARAGHTCNLRDGQMVVVGGYVGTSIPCDSPGVYVFNASSLQWQSSFTALSPQPDLHPENSVLAGSYGYTVPDIVVSAIGGSPQGSATATTPAAGPATGGPFATGKPPVYTITASGSTATVTQWGPGATGSGGSGDGGDGYTGPGGASPPGSPGNGGSGVSAGLIAACVVAGLAALLAGYLGYCSWLYKRQVRAYKAHLAVANRYSGPAASKASFGRGFAAFFGRKGSKESRTGGSKRRPAGLVVARDSEKLSPAAARTRRDESSSTGESFAWVGEPKRWALVDEPSPAGSGGTGGGTSSSDPAAAAVSQGEDSVQSTPPSARRLTRGGRHVAVPPARRTSDSGGSTSSTELLLEGQEPSFFSVVLGPRRALRVVNGLEEGETGRDGAGGGGGGGGGMDERVEDMREVEQE